MAERRQEILDLARQRPIPPGRGLPAYQEPGSKNTGPLTVYVFNRTGIVSEAEAVHAKNRNETKVLTISTPSPDSAASIPSSHPISESDLRPISN